MKKGLITTGIILAVLVGGGFTANQYVSNKIGDEVIKMTEDPEVKKQIDKALAQVAMEKLANAGATPNNNAGSTGTNNGQAAAGQNGQPAKEAMAPAGKGLSFADKNEAIAYAKAKFTTAEIASYTAKFLNRNSLSKEEREQIKQDILSRFTSEEIRALQEAASK